MSDQNEAFRVVLACPPLTSLEHSLEISSWPRLWTEHAAPVPESLLLFRRRSKQRWQVIWTWLVCCGFCILSTVLERI